MSIETSISICNHASKLLIEAEKRRPTHCSECGVMRNVDCELVNLDFKWNQHYQI